VSGIRRRELIILLGGSAAAAWPLAARAQPESKLPTIGFLGSATSATQGQWVAAFVQRLRELGWIEGRSIAIEFRWAEGRTERYAEIAAEFVRLNVDIIVTVGTTAVVAAKQATSIIPIVFASVGDPVGSGLVKTLARPGGNVTGLSQLGTDLAAKRLELLREVLSDLRQVGVLGNADNPASVAEIVEIQAASRTLGLAVAPVQIQRPDDIAPAFEALKGRADALMSYGPNLSNQFRRAADFVDKILRKTKAGDIPVEQATKFDLTINLTTAKALGLTIPESFLLRADEVIE
jgi:putative ABC transport system substrate-binding protein